MPSSIVNLIAPQLPYLRRFARALAGSPIRGDAYVAATLEAIIAGHGLFQKDIQPKVALYRVFQQIWNSLQADGVQWTTRPRSCNAASHKIEKLTPMNRQAFLLAALDEFSPAEIAVILDVDEKRARELIAAAGREISEQISTTVLIIEDELLVALELEQIVTDLGHKVIGVAKTQTEATSIAGGFRPGIVLADMRLADGSSGLDAVNDILEAVDVPVVFITAYPERLLTGERPEPTFIITKPFRSDSVKAAISQALFFDMRATRAPDLHVV